MKHILRLSALLTVAVVITGCGGASPYTPPSTPSAQAVRVVPARPVVTPERSAPTSLSYEVLNESALPAELSVWKEAPQPPKSTGSARIDGYLYVFVTGGTESIGASAITVRAVTLSTAPQTSVEVAAVLTPGQPGKETSSFPRSYIRIPYDASLPVPDVWVKVEHEAAVVEPGTPVTNPPPVTTPPADTFVVISERELPPVLSAWPTSTVQLPGGVARYESSRLYLMVTAGQRNSGGYSVEIREVQVTDGVIHVAAILHTPKPGQMVTTAITYPKAYAMLNLVGQGEPQIMVDFQEAAN